MSRGAFSYNSTRHDYTMKRMTARERESTSPSDEEEEEEEEENRRKSFFADLGILDSGQSFVENSHGFLEMFWYRKTLTNGFRSMYIRYQTAFSVAEVRCPVYHSKYFLKRERERERETKAKCGIIVLNVCVFIIRWLANVVRNTPSEHWCWPADCKHVKKLHKKNKL